MPILWGIDLGVTQMSTHVFGPQFMTSPSLFKEQIAEGVFCILAHDDAFVFYAPYHGLLMSVNAAFVRQVQDAVKHGRGAPAGLGVDDKTWRALLECPDGLSKRFDQSACGNYRPTEATLFLTQRCTLRCRYCYCHGGQGETMSPKLAKRAIDITVENAVQRGLQQYVLNIHGGDIGACWDLFEYVVDHTRKSASEAGLEVVIGLGVNGYYTPKQVKFIAANTSEATLSWDGTPVIHDSLRPTFSGKPSSAHVLRTAQLFDECDYSYSIRMTVADRHAARLAHSVLFFCKNCEAKEIRAEPLYRRGRAVDGQLNPPDPQSFVEAFRAAEIVAQRYGRRLTYSAARAGLVTGCFCAYATPTFGVTPQGDITCCYEVLRPEDPLARKLFFGRLDPETLTLSINRKKIDAIRYEACTRRDACAHCFCVAHCAGDCIAKAEESFATEDSALSARCEITRELTKDQLCRLLMAESPPGMF